MLKDGDPKEFQKSAVKLKRHSQDLKDYCERTGLTYQNERTSVLGYGHSEASKVTAAYRRALRQEELKNQLLLLDNSDESVIMELKGTLTNKEARQWYLQQDKKIPDLIDKSLPIEEQARQACDLRNKFRTQTRDLMADQEKRKSLDISDPNPSFDDLVSDKMNRKGMSREEAVKDVLRTATKTRKSINVLLELEE